MIRKIYDSLFDNEITKISKKKQVKYLSKFNPKNDLERSFFQYKCQMKKLNLFARIIVTFGSMVVLLINKFSTKNSNTEQEEIENVLLFVHDLVNVPEQYRKSYVFLESITGYWIDDKSQEAIRELRKKYFWSFYFRLKLNKKICFYNYILKKYNPRNIITSNEYSFTSSYLTYFLEKNAVNHIDVMHGDKIFDINDSFFRFTKIYAWNQDYINLFTELRAEVSSYEIYVPIERFSISKVDNPEHFLTVYLQNQNKREMQKLATILKNIDVTKIAIRPHPRYTNVDVMNKVFAGFIIEDTKKVSCEESVANTSNVLTIYSTVAIQADLNDVNVIIDDVSKPNIYKTLEDLDYVLLKKYDTLTNFILKTRDGGNENEILY